MIALLYPFLILILIIVAALTIYKRLYLISVVLVAFCLVLNYYAKVFAATFGDSSNSNESGLKILTFNINGTNITYDNDIQNLFNLIASQDADVLFLVEDFDPIGKQLHTLLTEHYLYSTYEQKTNWSGHYFYSKYPLGKIDHIDIESTRFSYCFHCNIAYGQDSISLYGCHLASNNYIVTEPSIRPEDINGVSSFWEYLKNIEMATEQRCEEVESIMSHTNFNHRSIVLGDFNDVCGSKPLNFLERAGLKDAWWEKGVSSKTVLMICLSHYILLPLQHERYKTRIAERNTPRSVG